LDLGNPGDLLEPAMTTDLKGDVEAVGLIDAVPKILDSVGRITGMGFVAIARVT